VLENLTKVFSVALLLFASSVNANYIYEANQSLFDLTNQTGTTNMASGDDQVSGAFNLDFTFTFYGEDFTSARMATNGCLHFKTTGSYCNDYTPDPLPEITYTLYPFWTDLIRDNGSKVLAKNFTDKTVFGWYDLREYNRSGSDNSFEVILWNSNDTFEFRYGGLDIINHDVLIGEQGTSSELYTYYYHDQCGKGTTNSSSCVSQTWNASTMNTTLENGGSLYGLGSGNALDCSSPLNNSACVGYDAAYLTQQCGLDSLHSTSCPLYWEAYDDLQCDLDPQYAPFCAGYTQEASVAYYIQDEFDYGYEEDEQYGYEEYDNTYYDDDPYANMEFTDEEWYEIDVEEFGQEQVDEWYGTEVSFSDDGMVEWDSTEYESYDDIDVVMDEYDEQIRLEEEMLYEEEYFETLDHFENDLPLFEDEYIDIFALNEDPYELDIYETSFSEPLMFEEFERQELIHEEEHEEPVEFLEFETLEELEEWFEEEVEMEEEYLEEELFEEEIELVEEEIQEEEIEEVIEETEEVRVAEEEKSGISKEMQLNVVSSTIQTATNSVSGTTSGTSIHATGNTKASGGSVAGNTTATAVTSSVTGGQSMSNSPSISAQVVSSVMQTQQVLNTMSVDNTAVGNTMSVDNTAVGNTNSNSNVAVGSDTTDTTETTDNSSVASNTSGDNNTAMGNTSGAQNVAVGNTDSVSNVAVGSVQAEITVAIAEVSTSSEADNVADKIIADNIKQQQEQLEEKQQETGEYADSSTLIAFMGFVPGFSDYRQVEMPRALTWYEPEDIYTGVMMPDNTQAFYSMYGDSLNSLNKMKQLQPNL